MWCHPKASALSPPIPPGGTHSDQNQPISDQNDGNGQIRACVLDHFAVEAKQLLIRLGTGKPGTRVKAKAKFNCLILEDDPCCAQVIADSIRDEGGHPSTFQTIREAMEAVEQEHFDLAVLDHNLPDGRGSDFFYFLHERRELTLSIMLTAFPDLPKAVELTRSGLFDYFTKPFAPHDFTMCIRRAVARFLQPEWDLADPDYADDSSVMRDVRRKIQDAARHPQATILLTGETGTGKDITARIIHQQTFKKEGAARPFISLNCSTLPADMFEAELFGAQRGAYTGAHQNRTGLCEAANGGTLFLDEIAEVPMALQAKLLQFLENFEYRHLGSTETLKFEGRIIAATNKSLAEEVEHGRFRSDLLYRLDVLVIHLPPLRERKADLGRLCEVLLEKLSGKHSHQKPNLREEDLAALMEYDFPGNIRELRNLLERSLLQTPREQNWLQIDAIWARKMKAARTTEVRPAEAPVSPGIAPEPAPARSQESGGLLEEQEYALIQRVLLEEKGAIRKAAARLGLTHQSLLRRLEKWPELRAIQKSN